MRAREPADERPRLVVGPGGHGARVDDVDFRVLVGRYDGEALTPQGGSQGFGLVLIELAPEGVESDPHHPFSFLSTLSLPCCASTRLGSSLREREYASEDHFRSFASSRAHPSRDHHCALFCS